MISDLLYASTILIGVVGVALLLNLARVWMLGYGSVTDPELRRLSLALAMVAFAGLYFLGRGIEDSGSAASTDPIPADPQPTSAERGEDASLARLTVAARLPSLQSRQTRPKPPPEKPSPAPPKPSPPSPAADEAPVSPPPPQDVQPAAEPAPASVPAPAPEPEPAPAPEPSAPPVAFDDSG